MCGRESNCDEAVGAVGLCGAWKCKIVLWGVTAGGSASPHRSVQSPPRKRAMGEAEEGPLQYSLPRLLADVQFLLFLLAFLLAFFGLPVLISFYFAGAVSVFFSLWAFPRFPAPVPVPFPKETPNRTPKMVKQVMPGTSAAEFRRQMEGQAFTLVDFYAQWCGPCKMIAPQVDQLAMLHPHITFLKACLFACLCVSITCVFART